MTSLSYLKIQDEVRHCNSCSISKINLQARYMCARARARALLVPVKQEVIPTHNSFNKHLIIELSKSIIGETIFKNSKVIE